MLFGRDKALENLSAEDQAWFKENRRYSPAVKLIASAEEGATERVAYLMGKHDIAREDRFRAALAATKATSPESIGAILARHGFDFSESANRDAACAAELFQAALQTHSLPTWKKLWELNRKTHHGQLNHATLTTLIPADIDLEFLRAHLTEVTTLDVFSKVVHRFGMQSPARLKFVLGWAHKFDGVQDTLDTALAAATSDAALTEVLLSFNADPNASGALALRNAIESANADVIKLLLPRVDLERHGDSLLAELQSAGLKADELGWLEEKVAAVSAEKHAQSLQEKYALVDCHTLSETKRVTETMSVTTLFNFASGQQTTIARDGDHLAVTVVDFADISSRTHIDNMRAKLAALGGEADGSALYKNKLTPKP